MNISTTLDTGIIENAATEQLAVRISPENPNPSTALGAGHQERLAIRIAQANPNHHLWNNHGVWWTHFTVHRPDYTKKRIRLSLGTKDLEQARRIRDLFLAGFTGVQLEG